MKLTFLGQSGFVIDDGRRTVVDPFLGPLEDPLEAARFPRLADPPLSANDLQHVDTVCVSHHHGDHCHLASLRAIATNSPACLFVGPPSVRDMLIADGFSIDRLVTPLLPGWLPLEHDRIAMLPAAHYLFSSRPDVTFDYFGFVIETSAGRIYVAGDTIPYPGQAALVSELECRFAILPVNGRDERRERLGIIGNMDVHESAALASAAGSEWVIPCHTGMFAENTVDGATIDDVLLAGCPATRSWRPTPGMVRTF
jgi:L-ascorbate metabolism protein UlaG (beta-lactamase superfamily)